MMIEVFLSILNQEACLFQSADYLEFTVRESKEASYVGCQSVRASKAISDKMLQENDFPIYLHFNKRNIQYSGN